MKMELLQSLKLLPCVPVQIRHKEQYVLDHVVRQYRNLGLKKLLDDCGITDDIPELKIEAGIGTLVLRKDGLDSFSGIPNSYIPRKLSDPVLFRERQNTCMNCDSYKDGKCSGSGCGCNGEGKPELWSSICPLGKWVS